MNGIGAGGALRKGSLWIIELVMAIRRIVIIGVKKSATVQVLGKG